MDGFPNDNVCRPMIGETMTDWSQCLIGENLSIRDVIHNLDRTALQIAIVISSDRRLIGTITDGDIRRGLLRGLDLDSLITTIIHHDPLVVPPELPKDSVLQIMHLNGVRQMPIVDKSRIVLGLCTMKGLLRHAQRDNVMVIMAGGKGSRLRPDTDNCPKPLLPIGGKPMLEHIIERAKVSGFRNFVLSVHYLGEMIKMHFGDGARWGVSISYIEEATPMGTAGGLSLLRDRFSAPFVVTNGDVLTDIDYGQLLEFHVSHKAEATMAVRGHEWQNPFGVVHTDGIDIVSLEEKPIIKCHINAGVYALSPSMINLLPSEEHCDMPELFSRAKERNLRTIAYPMHEPWLDIGRPNDLKHARSLSI